MSFSITDSARSRNKSTPYLANTQGPLKFLNGRAYFAGLPRLAQNQIVCRHMAYDSLFERRQHNQDKLQQERPEKSATPFHYTQRLDARLGSPQKIRQHITLDTEKHIAALMQHAKRRSAVSNELFGTFASHVLGELEPGQSRQFYFQSLSHAMQLDLKVKKDEAGNRVYVLSITDPKFSTTHTRLRTSSLAGIKKHSLSSVLREHGKKARTARGKRQFQDAAKAYKAQTCVFFEVPQELQRGQEHPPTQHQDRIYETFLDGAQTATDFHLLIASGMPLDRLKQALQSCPNSRARLALLKAKRNNCWDRALHSAVWFGQAHTVQEFGQLVQTLFQDNKLSAKEVFELLKGDQDNWFKRLFAQARFHQKPSGHVFLSEVRKWHRQDQLQPAVQAYLEMLKNLKQLGALTTKQALMLGG